MYATADGTPEIDVPAFLTPKQSISLPNIEAQDFTGGGVETGHFMPFIGTMYLPAREASVMSEKATETYIGINSYSASHIQGVDDPSFISYFQRIYLK
ncbi:PREDICTED: uncharacterized protein LOC108360917 [Rhagoletis zephyria]|uniref:uncharacterized protein LOC108360917 n=1 Tax=Rhagoletis zephyria TaxID=28612 RepID=UPI00081151A2|nr:PREDICTED: uncharacterized protein LOC108360917 [Rhagoletis zephyria]